MGNKIIFSTSGSFFQHGANKVYLTNLSFNEAFDRIETTDTATTGDGKEYATGRAERTFTIEIMYNISGAADLPLNSVAVTTASFEGKTFIGNAALYSKQVQGSLDDAIRATYEGAFNGSVVVTNKA